MKATVKKTKPVEPKVLIAEDGKLAEQHKQLPALSNTPDMLIAMAIQNGNISIDVLERLSKLQQEWLERQAKSIFKQAMADFQSEVPAIPKAKNVNFKTKAGDTVDYNHAELDRIVTVIQPFKNKFNLSHDWKYRHFKDDKGVAMIEVTCIISHPSGHSEQTSMEGEHDSSGGKNNIQGRGSTVTYLQRYTLQGAFGIVTSGTDNDGGKMKGSEPEEKVKATPAKPAMNTEQLNKAILRITKGEDIISECKSQFTLTDKQKTALESADEVRKLKKEEK